MLLRPTRFTVLGLFFFSLPSPGTAQEANVTSMVQACDPKYSTCHQPPTYQELCAAWARSCDDFTQLANRYPTRDLVASAVGVCHEARYWCGPEPRSDLFPAPFRDFLGPISRALEPFTALGRFMPATNPTELRSVTENLGVLESLHSRMVEAEPLGGHPDAVYPTWSPFDVVGGVSASSMRSAISLIRSRGPRAVVEGALIVNLIVAPASKMVLSKLPPVPLASQAVRHLHHAEYLRRASWLGRVQSITTIVK